MDISVVIASYNHAPYLAACIRSALEQTHAPAEVIVIDDGSTDGSREVIEGFGAAVRPVFQENAGTYATLNRGIELAQCDWVAIHNSDDLWRVDKLASQAKIAENDPRVGLVHTGVEYIDAQGDILQNVEGADLRPFRAEVSYEALPVVLRTNPVVISSVLLSKAIWSACGKFDEQYLGMGDWEFCIRAAQHARFGFVDQPLTLVRKHSSSAGMDPSRLPSDWGGRDWQRMLMNTMPDAGAGLFKQAREGRVNRNQAAIALASLATLQTREGLLVAARTSLRMAMRLSPLRAKTYARYLMTLKRSIRH